MRNITVTIMAGFTGLAACTQSGVEMADYAFVGSWNCEGTVFALTNTTYHNGAETLAIKAVEADGRNYKLYLSDGSLIGLAAVTDTGLTLVPGVTGGQLHCSRVI